MSVSKDQSVAAGPQHEAPVELTEDDLDKVAGGFLGFYVNKPTTPTTSTQTSGVKGESMDGSHKGGIE